MTVTDVHKDPQTRTMTITAEFDVPVERAWQLWSDPRQLERWWGPPTYPATFVEHDLRPGGLVTYFMTGPEGDKSRGLWHVREVQPPRLLVVEDAFADEEGRQSEQMPVTLMRVELADREGGGTRVRIASIFPSVEAMEQLIEMGMEEGMRLAMGQMDAILVD